MITEGSRLITGEALLAQETNYNFQTKVKGGEWWSGYGLDRS